MRDPNTEQFRHWTELMASGQMVGPDRPVGRVTVGRNSVRGHLSDSKPGMWRNVLFEQGRQVEISGITSINIDRSVGQDAATCTITLANDDMHYEYRPEGIDTGVGRPGIRTFNRGIQSEVPARSIYDDFDDTGTRFPTDWGYRPPESEPNSDYTGFVIYEGGSGGSGGADKRYLRSLLIPNRLVRVYQGYGSDNFDEMGNPLPRGAPGYVPPMYDRKLVQMGVFLIDTVAISTAGMITLTCRDLAKLLLVQTCFPPMVPVERYPLQYGPPGSVDPASETGRNVGEITDWSDAVKELVAWAGFTWWARPGYFHVASDPLLGTDPNGPTPLRVWGDFELLGAGPVHLSEKGWFAGKSFMEGVNQIKDALGVIFFVDESGGAVFKHANFLQSGNFIHDPMSYDQRPFVPDLHPIEFHENANLISYEVTLDDSQVRSEVFVTGSEPEDSAQETISGGVILNDGERPSAITFRNVLAGQDRLLFIGKDRTAGFANDPPELQKKELQVMAEMTGMFILFTYRKGRATIAGHPGLQLDDQVRIYERKTHEFNIHYVSGISSQMDLETGSWTMDVTTHWLGTDPNADWFLNYNDLTEAAKLMPAIRDAWKKAEKGEPFEGEEDEEQEGEEESTHP